MHVCVVHLGLGLGLGVAIDVELGLVITIHVCRLPLPHTTRCRHPNTYTHTHTYTHTYTHTLLPPVLRPPPPSRTLSHPLCHLLHRHDDGQLKYEALVSLCSSFRAKNGRDPTFWLDKVR